MSWWPHLHYYWPKLLTGSQIPSNSFYPHTVLWKWKLVEHKVIGSFLRRHRFIKEGWADLHNPDMNRVKRVRQQIRGVMLWEFFLLSLFKVTPETGYLISWLLKESLKQLFFKDIYFLERTSLFVLYIATIFLNFVNCKGPYPGTTPQHCSMLPYCVCAITSHPNNKEYVCWNISC